MKNFSKTFVFLLIATAISFAKTSIVRADVHQPRLSFEGSLQIKANLYFGDESEDVSPVERTKFYLLEDDLITILQNADFNPVDGNGGGGYENKPLSEEADYLEAVARAFDSDDENSILVSVLIRSAIAERMAAKVETDAFGIGEVKSVKPGKFYLFGITCNNGETLVWNLPVELKYGGNLIELDQYNAATLIESDK